MARSKILDTNVLITHWHRLVGTRSASIESVEEHARSLIARDSQELALYSAYLGQFEVVDRGEIPRQDWEQAKRHAKRIGRRNRKLGDCLLQAIAERLNCDIISRDSDIVARTPPRA